MPRRVCGMRSGHAIGGSGRLITYPHRVHSVEWTSPSQLLAPRAAREKLVTSVLIENNRLQKRQMDYRRDSQGSKRNWVAVSDTPPPERPSLRSLRGSSNRYCT